MLNDAVKLPNISYGIELKIFTIRQNLIHISKLVPPNHLLPSTFNLYEDNPQLLVVLKAQPRIHFLLCAWRWLGMTLQGKD